MEAVGQVPLRRHEVLRCRNYTALGVVCWLVGQSPDAIRCRTAGTSPTLIRANRRALREGHRIARSLELPAAESFTAQAAANDDIPHIATGSEALACG